ncbi:Photosystem I assembly protein Ycf3 [uncultured archaeon]|nr:Photosystem I assembly protein Ycf3 [uncultured archaeon]
MRRLLLILLLGIVLTGPTLGQQTAKDWLNQGDALCKQGRYTEAIQAYDRGIELSPQWTDLYYHKGHALNAQKRYDDAVEAFNKVNEVNPKDGVLAWHWIGRTLSTAGRYDEAIQAYDKSIQAFSTYGEWWAGQKDIRAQSWYFKGLAFDAMGKFTEAQNAYDNAMVLNPSITKPDRAVTSSLGKANPEDITTETNINNSSIEESKTVLDNAAKAIESQDEKGFMDSLSNETLSNISGNPDLSTPEAAKIAEGLREAKIVEQRIDKIAYETTIDGIAYSFNTVKENGTWKISGL